MMQPLPKPMVQPLPKPMMQLPIEPETIEFNIPTTFEPETIEFNIPTTFEPETIEFDIPTTFEPETPVLSFEEDETYICNTCTSSGIPSSMNLQYVQQSIETELKEREYRLEELESEGIRPILKLKDFGIEPIISLPNISLSIHAHKQAISSFAIPRQNITLQAASIEESALLHGLDFDINKVTQKKFGSKNVSYSAKELRDIVKRYKIAVVGNRKENLVESIQEWYRIRFGKF